MPGGSVNDHLIAVTRILSNRLDDAFEDMADDEELLNGEFANRKIKERHKHCIKNEKVRT
jgi:hypothetical protein